MLCTRCEALPVYAISNRLASQMVSSGQKSTTNDAQSLDIVFAFVNQKHDQSFPHHPKKINKVDIDRDFAHELRSIPNLPNGYGEPRYVTPEPAQQYIVIYDRIGYDS